MPTRPVAPKPGFLSRQVLTSRHFYRDLSPRRRTGLHVVSAGYEQCDRNYSMRRSSFPWFGIELVASGGGRLELPDGKRDLASGLVFSYGPGTPHAIFSDAERPPGKWFIDLAGNAVPDTLQRVGLAPGSAGLIDSASPARALFDLIVDTGRRSGPEADLLLTALAQALLLALAHPCTDTTHDLALAQASYERCRTWIEAHAAAGAGVQEAAAALSLSPAYVSRLFQRFDRVSPGAYARRVRLQQAADRLVMTADLIKDIAASAGYADAFHFSRAFTRAFGLSPRDFRSYTGSLSGEQT
jgi:AraC-like DNA-binding protein